MAQYMVQTGDGSEIGPLGGREIRARVRSGQLKPTDLLRPAEGGRWRPLSSVPGLASELGAAGDREPASEPWPPPEPPPEPPAVAPAPMSRPAPNHIEADVIDLGFADRVLRLGFAIGRVVSVIVIVLAVLAILGAIVVMVVNEFTPIPPLPPPRTISQPQVQDFVITCKPASATGGISGNPSRSSYGASGLLDPCAAWRARIQHICTTMRLPSAAEEALCRTVPTFDLPDRENFLDAFTRFADAFGALNPRPKDCSPAEAADWFVESYREQVKARDLAAMQAAAAQQAALNSRDARRWQATVTVATAVGALISFLVLPLLIQIERNTRARRNQLSS